MQIAVQMCWNSLDDATHLFQKLMAPFFPFSIMLCFRSFPFKCNNQKKNCCHGHSRHETHKLCVRDDPCQFSTSHQVGPHNIEGNLIKPGLLSFNFWVQVNTEIKDTEIDTFTTGQNTIETMDWKSSTISSITWVQLHF
jgi:hypothetical protein